MRDFNQLCRLCRCYRTMYRIIRRRISKQVKNSGDARGDSSITPTIAMYPVKEDGTWDETSEYTANGLGYWFDGNRMFHRMEIIVSTLLNLVKEVFCGTLC